MSILTWIEDKKRLKLLNAPKYVNSSADSSKGLWTRCDKCGVILYIKHLKENQRVCFGCSYHLQMMSQERIENLLDKVPASSSINSPSNVGQKTRELGQKKSQQLPFQSFGSPCTPLVAPFGHSNGGRNSSSAKRTCKKRGALRQEALRTGGFLNKNPEARTRSSSRENMVSTWRPLDETVSPCDPLKFHDQKKYTDRLKDAQERTGLQDAIQTGTGMIDGIPVALAVMDFSFMGGSMGSVVGEKITRLIEYATAEGLTLLIVSASGGARMQEGVFSLMQMAKISSALQIYQSCAKLLYISILTSPTTGGVTASFAMLGDIIFAEPKALIAFAGRRVIEQTLAEDLPEDFQTSESMLHHGLVDLIVPRRFLRQAVSESIRLYQNAPFKKVGIIPFGVQNPITFLTEEKVRRQWSTLTKRGTKQFTKKGLNSSIGWCRSSSPNRTCNRHGKTNHDASLTDSRFGDQTFQKSKTDQNGSSMGDQRKTLRVRATESMNPALTFRETSGFESFYSATRTFSGEDQNEIKYGVYREILTSFEMMLNLFASGKGIRSNTTDLKRESKPAFLTSIADKSCAYKCASRACGAVPLLAYKSSCAKRTCTPQRGKKGRTNLLGCNELRSFILPLQNNEGVRSALVMEKAQRKGGKGAYKSFTNRRFVRQSFCQCHTNRRFVRPIGGQPEGLGQGGACKARTGTAKNVNGEKAKTTFNQNHSYPNYKSEKSSSAFTKVKRESENEAKKNRVFLNGVKKGLYPKLAKELYQNCLQGTENRGNENGTSSINELINQIEGKKGYNQKMPLSKHIAFSLTKKRFIRVISVIFASTIASSTSKKTIDSTTSFLTPTLKGLEKQSGFFKKRGFVKNTQHLRFASFSGFLSTEEIAFSSDSVKEMEKNLELTSFGDPSRVNLKSAKGKLGHSTQPKGLAHRFARNSRQVTPHYETGKGFILPIDKQIKGCKGGSKGVFSLKQKIKNGFSEAREAQKIFDWKSVYGNLQNKIRLYKKFSTCKRLTSQLKRIEKNRAVPLKPFTFDPSNLQKGWKKTREEGFTTQSSLARQADTPLKTKEKDYQSIFPVWPQNEVDRFDLLHNFKLVSEGFLVKGFRSPSQEENSNRFSQASKDGPRSKIVDFTTGNADINFLNQAIELAATDSVEWRAFYIHQQLSENIGFLEDFLQQDPNSREKNGNLLFYKSICRSQKALNE